MTTTDTTRPRCAQPAGLRSSLDKAGRLLTSFLAGLRCQVRLCFKLDKLPEGGVQAVEVEGDSPDLSFVAARLP